jgi:hypothetical protein
LDLVAPLLVVASAVLGIAIVPALLGFGLRRLRPAWPVRRASWVAATPYPLIVGIIVLRGAWRAADTPSERCGIDACTNVVVASVLTMLFFVPVALAIGLAVGRQCFKPR